MIEAHDIRMLVLDIDGTLLRPERTISPRVRDAVRAAAMIVPVMLATARPPRSVRAICETLNLWTPQVNYNGALLWDPLTRTPVQHLPLAQEHSADLMRQARALFPDVVIGVEHLDRWHTDRVDERFTTETGKLFPPDVIEPYTHLCERPVTKLMFHADAAEIDALRGILESKFAADVAFIRTDPDLLQMMNRGTSKWKGVVELAGRRGIAPSQLMTIGDNENDLEMIGGAGLGIAMANACEAALQAARWVAPSNADDGVAHAIERFLLRS